MISGYYALATFDVDLNAVRDGNRITTLLKHASGYLPQLASGDWVFVRDEEHDLWGAIVDRVQEDRVELKIDWSLQVTDSHQMTSEDLFSTLVPAGLISEGDQPLVTI